MPAMKLSVEHALGQQVAAERLKLFSEKIKKKYEGQVKDFYETWHETGLEFGFTTLGATIKGKLQVEEDKVDFDGELPFAAMLFKGRIETEIRDSLTAALA